MIGHNQNNVKNPLKVPFWNPLISLPSFWYCSTGIINKSFMPCASCKNECIGPTPPKMAGIWFCLMSANQSVTKRVINLSKPKKRQKRQFRYKNARKKPIYTGRINTKSTVSVQYLIRENQCPQWIPDSRPMNHPSKIT